MDPIGMTIQAADILYSFLQFYRQYQAVPNTVRQSLEQLLIFYDDLNVILGVFQRLDQSSVDKKHYEIIIKRFVKLEGLLGSHKNELVDWMVGMGLPEPTFESESQAHYPEISPAIQAKKSRSSHVFLDLQQFKGPFIKTAFVLFGSTTLRIIEKNVKGAVAELRGVMIIIAPTAKFIPRSPNSSIEPAIFSFVATAKDRSLATVLKLSNKEWNDLAVQIRKTVDDKMALDRQIQLCTIVPASGVSTAEIAARKLSGEYICCSRSNDADRKESENLARLFAVDSDPLEAHPGMPREDGNMLRCRAVVERQSSLLYVFKMPPGSSSVRTLRNLLLDEGACPNGQSTPYHTIADRIQFAIRLASSVLVVHALGLVHKRIRPENILVIDFGGSGEFPYTLGYPYLVGFDLARTSTGSTSLIQDLEELRVRGIYIHPREQASPRKNPYSMISDIYSLGVCLFEIALWRSLFSFDDEKSSYTVYNSSPDFANLVDRAYKNGEDLKGSEIALRKTEELIRIAKKEIPRTLGKTFADVVVSCLRAGDPNSPFEDQGELKGGDGVNFDFVGNYDYVSVKYLDLVLRDLRVVYDGVSGNH